MKKQNYKMLLLIVLGLVLTLNLFAQDKYEIKRDREIKSLINGICSENEGLRRNSIYFAGRYKIKEAAPHLISAFNKEKGACTKILIAFSLYQIGEPNSLAALKEVAKNEADLKVRMICNAVYEQFINDNLLGLK